MDRQATYPDTIPSHVPADRVRDYDLYQITPGQKDLMESVVHTIEVSPRLFYTPRNGGHWVVIGYDDANDIIKDTVRFSNKPYSIPTFDEPPLAPLLFDPPAHGIYRAPLQKFFTPRSAALMSERIQATASGFIDAVAKQGNCDFVASVAELLPVSVLLDLLGLPTERLKEYRSALKTFMGSAEIAEKQQATAWIVQELTGAIQEKERAPKEDLISVLLDADLGGRKPTAEEMLNFCMQIFIAGLDTVTVTMTYGVRHLAEDKALQAWARRNPNKMADLAEELVRRYSAAQPARTLKEDVEIDNVLLKKGDRILLLMAAADLDSSVFDNPLQVDPERTKKPHLAFGAGAHRCIGMHLARVELQIAYREWLARIPSFEIDPAHPQSFTGGHVLAINDLWLRWPATS